MSDPFYGEIRMVGFTFAPEGWANCDGAMMQIQQNPTLYSLLGTIYGGNGVTTFGLPDLRGRVAVHTGTGPGLTPRQMGQAGGVESNITNVSQMPAHTHTGKVRCNTDPAATTVPTGHTLAAGSGRTNLYIDADPNENMRDSTVEIDTTGNGLPINNMQPWLCVRFCIALQGIYPQRP